MCLPPPHPSSNHVKFNSKNSFVKYVHPVDIRNNNLATSEITN